MLNLFEQIKNSISMIQTGWLVSDSLLILYVKTKVVIKWWLTNTSSNIAIRQYIAIRYKAIRNTVLTRIVASLLSITDTLGPDILATFCCNIEVFLFQRLKIY